MKLISPNTPPITAPPAAPSVMDAMMTGTARNVISTIPALRKPSGVNPIITVIAAKSAYKTICFVLFIKKPPFSGISYIPIYAAAPKGCGARAEFALN